MKDGGPFNNPFQALKDKLGPLPEGPPAPAAPPPAEPVPKGPARAVVRLEKKGHGGKQVTRVEKLELRPAELERWLKELKQGLGCGGRVVDDALELQGDVRARVGALLEARGVRKVTMG